jgi:hypothetical protein
MARRGQEKAIVSQDALPNFKVFSDGRFGYAVRYRILSEDGARFSHWSPVFKIIPNYIFTRPNGKTISDIIVISQGPYINVVWETVAVVSKISNKIIKQQQDYDLFLKWDKGETNGIFLPTERVGGAIQGFVTPSSYALSNGTVVEETPTRVSVEIYVRGNPPSRNHTDLLVYKRDSIDISVPFAPPAN